MFVFISISPFEICDKFRFQTGAWSWRPAHRARPDRASSRATRSRATDAGGPKASWASAKPGTGWDSPRTCGVSSGIRSFLFSCDIDVRSGVSPPFRSFVTTLCQGPHHFGAQGADAFTAQDLLHQLREGRALEAAADLLRLILFLVHFFVLVVPLFCAKRARTRPGQTKNYK